MVWLIIYLILEFNLINSRRIIVKKAFIELDEMLIKRLNILSKMLDVVKAYDKKQFDDFGSRLYDYIKQYNDYDYNKKIRLDKLLNNECCYLFKFNVNHKWCFNFVSRFIKVEILNLQNMVAIFMVN